MPTKPSKIAKPPALDLAIQKPYKGSTPSRAEFARWIGRATAIKRKCQGAITLRIVDTAESAALNTAWRRKASPTNVLTFPLHTTLPNAPRVLGDIVVCAPVIKAEAKHQRKLIKAHWAHMVIHGVLHLLGYDHQQTLAARRMERLEIKLLAEFGFADPYVAR